MQRKYIIYLVEKLQGVTAIEIVQNVAQVDT